MRQISVVSDQTIFDIAAQEYGNAELAFQIVEDNELSGLNDLPIGITLDEGVDFDVTYPIIEGTIIYLQDYLSDENTAIAKELTNIIS